jgi:hypothetical protein
LDAEQINAPTIQRQDNESSDINEHHSPATTNEAGETEEEEETEKERSIATPTPRRGPARAAKVPMSYRGMVCMKKEHPQQTVDSIFLGRIDLCDDHTFSFSSAFNYFTRDTYLSEDDTMEDIHPCAFTTKVQTHNQDNPTYKDILRGSASEREQWDEAMTKELKSMADLGSFEMIPRPRGENILQSTWVFKWKQSPDGSLKKYKARFCVRGDQQIEGIGVFDTYAPVISWITVRLLLVISLVFNLATQQVDYTNDFCQVPIEQTVFVELPKGFEVPNKVLLLK